MAVQNFRVRHGIDILGTAINTASSTFNLVDSTATTVNIGRSATSLTIGSTSGTLSLRNPTIVGTQTTQNLFNTVATTVNFAGESTSLNIGSTSGTLTVGNPTLVGTQTTQNVFNTVATTVNAFGASTTLNLGATSGTVTLRNPTLVGTQTTQNVFNTVATTVNAFGVATSLNLGSNNSGTTTIRSSTTAVQNELTVGSTASITTSTTSPTIQGSTSASGTLTILSTSSATKSTAGVRLTETIISSSPTTGTLVVSGGVGIGGNLNVGGDITADGDIFIKAKDGTGGTITLGQGGDDSVNIQADISSSLLPDALNQDLGSSTKTWRNLWLNGTANIPTLSVSGNATITGSLTSNGNVTLGDASADTITINGTPTFNTAVSISGSNNLTVGGDVIVTGGDIISPTLGSTCTIFNTNTATLNIAGVATVVNIGATTGTTTVRNSLKVDGGLDVTGNLTFLGQPSWTEKTILLRAVSGGTDVDADAGGVLLKGTTNKEILWSDLNDAWTINQNLFPKTHNTYNLGSDSIRFNTGYFTSLVGNLTGNASTATALLNARTINGVSFDGTANISFSTSNVSEGTNLYYTDERVDDRVNALIIAGTGVQRTYDDTNNTYTLALDFTEFSTSNITEGTNQYFTTSRARSSISVSGSLSYNDSTGVISYTTPTTDGITEGTTNLYYTDERVDDRVNALIIAGTGVQKTYDDTANTYTLALDFTEFSTSNITEGTNQYYTTTRANSAIDARVTKSFVDGLGISYTSLSDKPTLFSGSYNDLTDKPTLFSGSYNDLTNVPTAFTADKIANTTAPTTATDPGTAGEIRYDSDYVYICVATDTWKRTPLSTW
jgi:cytoskeletal protein CcmA (bactofilin family)